MTRRRWIADEFTEVTAALTGEHANHLNRVLRVRVGQEFDIVVGDVVKRGTVSSIADRRVDFDLGKELLAVTAPDITLALAIFKFDRMEWAIEKCTELGVSRILPVIARRSDAHLASAAVKRVERWRRLALQASEQSRRAAPPEIAVPTKFAQATNLAGGRRFVLAESEETTSLRDAIESHPLEGEVVLAVGPEGGWTEEELQQFHNAGWTSVSLGRNILRAETAAIAAMAIVASGWAQDTRFPHRPQ
jgi:16S rRNA (uracil1498-N3)-methyltransferase